MNLVEYNCAEQLMMASKGRLFGDDTVLSAIPASDDLREQKRLVYQVRHLDPALWYKTNPKLSSFGATPKISLKTKTYVLP